MSILLNHLQKLLQLVLAFVGATCIYACGCACTEVGCPQDEKIPPFTFVFSPQFSASQLERLVFTRTNEDFIPIDSIGLAKLINYNLKTVDLATIIKAFPQRFEFSSYNYILKNKVTNQLDTIWNISYQGNTKTEVCNECKGLINCQDQLFEYTIYSNPQVLVNSATINAFEIPIGIK
jgi:hypothetical protein